MRSGPCSPAGTTCRSSTPRARASSSCRGRTTPRRRRAGGPGAGRHRHGPGPGLPARPGAGYYRRTVRLTANGLALTDETDCPAPAALTLMSVEKPAVERGTRVAWAAWAGWCWRPPPASRPRPCPSPTRGCASPGGHALPHPHLLYRAAGAAGGVMGRILALQGGMAVGKTTVARFLAEQGVPVFPEDISRPAPAAAPWGWTNAPGRGYSEDAAAVHRQRDRTLR